MSGTVVKKHKKTGENKKTANTVVVLDTYENIIANYNPSKNISSPRASIYEIAHILGKRATQIENGANPLIDVNEYMTVREIAEEELRQKKTPFILRRVIGKDLNHVDIVEYWKISDLEIIF